MNEEIKRTTLSAQDYEILEIPQAQIVLSSTLICQLASDRINFFRSFFTCDGNFFSVFCFVCVEAGNCEIYISV